MMNIRHCLSRPIKWNATADAEFPFVANVDGEEMRIRLNDFPEEKLYTLLTAEDEFEINEWPADWERP